MEELDLKISLMAEVPRERRCPYLGSDFIGPYCENITDEGEITEKSRMVCDIYSLQLWCLNREKCQRCIFYNRERRKP